MQKGIVPDVERVELRDGKRSLARWKRVGRRHPVARGNILLLRLNKICLIGLKELFVQIDIIFFQAKLNTENDVFELENIAKEVIQNIFEDMKNSKNSKKKKVEVYFHRKTYFLWLLIGSRTDHDSLKIYNTFKLSFRFLITHQPEVP